MRTSIQKLGKCLMTPLSIIVAAGLLLGIVSLLQNPAIVGSTLANHTLIQGFVGLVQTVVLGLFGLLPVLFAISVAMGMAKDNKEVAAFSTVIAFVLFHSTISYFLKLNGITPDTMNAAYLTEHGKSQLDAVKAVSAYDTVFGIFTYRMSIFGGIITGLWTAFIHNKFHKTELPVAFGFFSGTRFVPIMITLTMPVIGLVMYFIWPFLGMAINQIGFIISESGYFGVFIYGFLERLLIPTGLHHILNQLIRFTPFGGSTLINGEQVSGALIIYNTLMTQASPDLEQMRSATKFLSQGTHPFMLFGLPAACLAIYKTAKAEQKKRVKAVFIAAAFTSFLTGITEPIEFAFIFISPVLFLFHAFMAGMSFLLNNLLDVMIGNAQGGVFDFLIFGVFKGLETRWYINLLIGIGFAFIYYFTFKTLILKFDIKTPGREDEQEELFEEIAETDEKLGELLVRALGGKENIKEVENCISRLRLILNETSQVNEDLIKQTGSLGIVKINDKNIQIVYGTKVEKMANILKKTLRNL